MKSFDIPATSIIDSVTKSVTALTKLGIFLGGICIFAYCLNIGYFPQDLSIGDGALFLMVATCFGIIYAFFVVCLVSLGICLSPATRFICKIALSIIHRFNKPKKPPAHELAPFDWSAAFPALFAIFIVLGLGKHEYSAYWNLPLLSVALYLFYSVFRSSRKRLRDISRLQSSPLHTHEKGTVAMQWNPTYLKQSQWAALAMVVVGPLLFGHVSGQLLDAAMRFGKIRLEQPIIYVKAPYAMMLPKELVSKAHPTLSDYTPFDGTTVLFNGFGRNTIISFKDNGKDRTLKIPNEQIIVE